MVENLKENQRNNERHACGVGVCCVVWCGEKIQKMQETLGNSQNKTLFWRDMVYHGP